MAKVVSRDPSTGDTLRELDATPTESLPQIFAQAKTAQERWAALAPKARAAHLLQFRETLLNRADELIQLISRENGKPHFEAMVNEIFPSLELLGFFAKNGPRALRNKTIRMNLLKHRTSYLQYWPLGTVAIISPWNYPFLLPLGEIVMSLLCGNAVIFKPSEITPQIGLKIQELFEESGLPRHVLQTVVGDGALGAAIIQQKPAKIFFTGSVATGKKIMAQAAENLTPVSLELGGKDAMIVLPDADLDYASSAALWGGFSNSGQVCASVERLLVHESISQPFLALLKEKLGRLRQGPSHLRENDLGPTTYDKQRAHYARQLEDARAKSAVFIAGGEYNPANPFLKPVIVTGPNIEELEIYNEETFGPVVAVTTFRSIQEAIEKANRSKYGLLASIITRDISLGEQVAKQLEVGTVTINEVIYTAGIPETPWGGLKDSGFGRKHSLLGLQNFSNVRHIHKPRLPFLTFKSPWWYPYTPHQFTAFRYLLELYRRSWLDKLKAFPHFLMNLIKFIKEERRH